MVLGMIMLIGFFVLIGAALSGLGGRTAGPAGIVGAILFVGGALLMGQVETHDRLDAIIDALKRR